MLANVERCFGVPNLCFLNQSVTFQVFLCKYVLLKNQALTVQAVLKLCVKQGRGGDGLVHVELVVVQSQYCTNWRGGTKLVWNIPRNLIRTFLYSIWWRVEEVKGHRQQGDCLEKNVDLYHNFELVIMIHLTCFFHDL